MTASLTIRNTTQRWFSVETEFDLKTASLGEMLTANADDDELCARLRCANAGEQFRTGGAQGEILVERMS